MKSLSISLFRLLVCSSLLVAATCALTVAAPQTAQKKASPEEEQKRQKELERKTIVLLDEIVSAASSLKLPENRTFVLVSSANLMWNHDEKRARLDKIIKSGMVKKGEIILHQSGSFPMDFAMLKYGKGVAALAAADFGRTKAAADRFERYEFRIFARLLIAQALLGKKPNVILLKFH